MYPIVPTLKRSSKEDHRFESFRLIWGKIVVFKNYDESSIEIR